jgi:hypothetical protein
MEIQQMQLRWPCSNLCFKLYIRTHLFFHFLSFFHCVCVRELKGYTTTSGFTNWHQVGFTPLLLCRFICQPKLMPITLTKEIIYYSC